MKMKTILILLFAAAAGLSAPDDITPSGNFPAGLYGPVDLRMAGSLCNAGPCIWGRADFDIMPLQFYPPLDADNILNLKLPSWLNTTGKPIHLEGTYTDRKSVV